MFIPSTLGTISDSLGKILICHWWRVHVSSEILTVAGRNGFLRYYFFNSREGAWLSDSAIFEPVETEKKHETCSQADYYADQQSLSFLSLPQMLSAICW